MAFKGQDNTWSLQTGNTLSIKQIESPKLKEKKNNGKIVAKGILETPEGEFKDFNWFKW